MKIPAAVKSNLLKRHKYGAKRTTCLHGHNHASQKEAMWCVKLTQLVTERQISCLIQQPSYDLVVNGELICRHKPDFEYLKLIAPGKFVKEIVEVKGVKLPDWIIKHKLFCALYPHINYVVV